MLPNFKKGLATTPYKHLLSIKDLNQAHKQKNQTKMAETKPKFDKGKQFQIKPLKVEPKASRPTFTKNGSTHYNYMVHAEVKGNPEPIWFEYASPTQDALDKFVLNVVQWVVCMQPSDIACNIQPCEPPGEDKSKEQMTRELVDKFNTTPISQRTMPNTFNQDAPRSTNVSGNPWVFCYAWAKDLQVAEMESERTPALPRDQASVVAKTVYYAKELYKEMMKDISGTP